jgi:hypothetical protein
MSWLKKLLGVSGQPKTLLEEVTDKASVLIVAGYRRIASERGCAPTVATSDKEILDIYTEVATGFREVAKQRGEQLPATQINFIVLFFYQNYERLGAEHMNSHLQYELRKYMNEGLRPTYHGDLSLF